MAWLFFTCTASSFFSSSMRSAKLASHSLSSFSLSVSSFVHPALIVDS